VTPGATDPSADGKGDDQKGKDSSADDAAALPAGSAAQLPSPNVSQPVAAAVLVNTAPDAPPVANIKAALAVADAARARVKTGVTPQRTVQVTSAQDDTADSPSASSALDSGDPNGSVASSGSDDASGDAAASDALASGQPQAASFSSTLLPQIDFASLGGLEHFGLHGDAAGPANAAAGTAAPNAGPNAATAANLGIFGPNAIAANITASPAAASEPAVPLAGLAVAIASRAQAGASQFDIRLDPPELGRIDVRLDVDGSGQVRTHVTVDRADTLQLLQSQQPQLERALEQAGLKTVDNGLQFTLRDQSFAGQNGGSGGQHYANQQAAPLVIPDIDAAPIDTAQIYARLRLGRGLDISV
jgi:flagellar hook-length control protein FliK